MARDGAGVVVGKDDLVAQFRQACLGLKTVVEATGGAPTDVVKLTIYVLDVSEYKRLSRPIGAVYREFFGRHYPAITLVGARDLYDADDGCRIEIEGVAVLPWPLPPAHVLVTEVSEVCDGPPNEVSPSSVAIRRTSRTGLPFARARTPSLGSPLAPAL